MSNYSFFKNPFKSKMKKMGLLRILLLVAVVLSASSCSKKENAGSESETEKQIPKNVKDKISVGFKVLEPSSILNDVNIPDTLCVRFDGSVAKIEEVDKAPSSPILITPEIKGEWKWSGDSSLIFVPSENWKIDTKYKVTMPSGIFSNNVNVKKDFTFSTEPFSLTLTDSEFYINPENPDEKKVTCTIEASHSINKESVKESLITLTFDYKDSKGKITKSENIDYKISFDKKAKSVYIVSSNLQIPPYTSDVKISVKKGITAEDGAQVSNNIEKVVTVPGMSDYVKIQDVSTSLVKNNKQSYDQMLIIQTKGSVPVEELASHLEVYELPLDRPAMQGWKEDKNCYWTTEYVTKDILELAKKVEITAVPTVEPATSTNSFVYKATPDRFLYVKISSDINFFGGYKLRFDNESKAYETTFRVPRYQKELGIMSEGTILSLAGSKKLSLYSRGIDKVYYKLSRIMPKNINHLVSMSNGDMKNFRFDSNAFTEDNIAEAEYSSSVVPNASDSELSYFSFDFSTKLKEDPRKNLNKGLFIFQVADKESKLHSSYNQIFSDKRLILVTDIGFIVKRNADSSSDVFVQTISSGLPIQARVKIIGRNGNEILIVDSDLFGHAKIPPIENYSNEHAPVAYVVEKGLDLAFMPYKGNGRTLDFSNYDIGGEYGTSDPKKISAFVFSDRGMYRPGENAHFGVIAKAGDWNIDLNGTPIEAEIIDSNGSVAYNKRMKLSSSGFEEFDFSIQDYSPTGSYNVNLYLVKELKDKTERTFLTSQSIKVEEFLPDTLSISSSFEPLANDGWINPNELSSGNLKGNVSLKNLFGTPAAGNSIKAQVSLVPGSPVPNRFSDYHFSDPYYKNKSFEEFLGTATTDENGVASFDIDLSKFEKATYRLNFFAEGFEKGSGRSVSTQSSLFVSPLKYLIGYKADGKLSYINADTVRKLSLIAINQNLEKIDVKNVTAEIEDVRYVSTLVKQGNGLYKYQSVKKSYPLSSQTIDISKNGTEFVLPSDIPGEYKLLLKNEEGLVFNTVDFTIVGDKNTSRSLTKTAELEIKLESADLTPGSKAQIFIKAPYAGSGLITVERDRVYNSKWFKTDELSSVQTITIPNNMEGNGYISVMFTRSSKSDEIFMSPFCYGTVPFSIGKENRTNEITLDIPDEVKSGSELRIEYSSQQDGKIVIFAVDEGILQVAGYTTPNPVSEFMKKRALEVSTMQTLDLILPEFNILQTLSATGGGAEMDMITKNLNPFKRKINDSVAYWSGILDCSPQKKSVYYKIPDYFNGNLRVMAVSVSKDRMGNSQASTYARNTFIISPNVPLAVAPKDEFDVSVTVTNNHKGSGNDKITLKVEPSENLEIIGEKNFQLTISEGKDANVTLKVKAKDSLGNAELKFTASDATESSALVSTMSVRPLMPYQTWIDSGVTKNSSAQTDLTHKVYDEFAERSVAVSNIPASYEQGLSAYLEKYPYGCSEQVTSKAYPYLYADFIKSDGKTRADAEKIVNETIGIIQSRMKSDGNIGYWTSKSETNPFITLYCAEFLIDAQNKGFYVPSSLLSKVQNAVRIIIRDQDDSDYGIYLRSYGIYILTKSEIVTTSYIEKLESDITRKNFTPTDYEGLYLAASYAMLKQDKKANDILLKVKTKKIFDSSWVFHNDLHYIATYIDVIASYFPQRIGDIKAKEIDTLCTYLKNSFYNTHSTSTAIRALQSLAYVEKADSYSVSEISSSGKTVNEIELSGDSVLKGVFSSAAEKIKYSSDGTMPLYYQTILSGYEKELPQNAVKDGLEVTREYLSEDGKKLSSIKVGDTVTVKISFRSTKGVLTNIAMIDMSPAGFETDIQSIRDEDKSIYSWHPDYVDVREDRIVIYGTVGEKVNTYTYKVKAVNSGTFGVSPMFAESMYNKEIRAISPASSITILPSKSAK